MTQRYFPPQPQFSQPSQLSTVFRPADELVTKEVPRLCISLEALDKCGKTHYALFTAPDPICLVTNDTGTLHILKKACKLGRRIPHVLQLNYEHPPDVMRRQDIDTVMHETWKREWARYKEAMTVLAHEDPRSPDRTRTLVCDTMSELWSLCMLAHFGKIRSNPKHLYPACNNDFTSVFWELYKNRPDLNMILIHRLKKEYKPNTKGEDAWTGNYECQGFNQIGYMVDLVLRSGWDPVYKLFYTEVDRVTRFGAEYVGQRMYGQRSSFGFLGLLMFPDTALTPAIWGL